MNTCESKNLTFRDGRRGWSSIHPSLHYLLSDVLATLQVMVSVGKDLRLHNWNDTILRDITRQVQQYFAMKISSNDSYTQKVV